MQRLHGAIFGDVYEWAGQLRVGPTFPQTMSKIGPSPAAIARSEYLAEPTHSYSYFPAGHEMVKHFDRFALRLGDNLERLSTGGGVAQFVAAIAEPWGEMNVAHLFREGNTRTQLVFFHQIAATCGFALDLGRLHRDEQLRAQFNAARYLIQAGGAVDLFAETIVAITTPYGTAAAGR